MKITRRDTLMGTLLGGGMLGLRALATGLPARVLLSPEKALADMSSCPASAMPQGQFVIFNTSGAGDPIGCNAPGTYDDPTSGVDLSTLAHPANPAMAPVKMMIGGKSYTAATPWTQLAPYLDRTCFCHIMTNTPVHPKEPQVLQLMGSTLATEMFPSVLAKQLAATTMLSTLQPQPISVGALTPSEALSYGGQALPTIPPSALRATLANPDGALSTLQSMRDSTLTKVYAVYKNGATKAQQQYIDSLVTSQTQVRCISQTLLSNLNTITDNSVASQIIAAVTLIQMNVSPVIAIHIPFGGDNHSDQGLATEAAQTVSGMASIVQLLQALATANLSDRVSFVSLNVFGRTMSGANTAGRQHNENHQMSLMIGKPFRGGVVGGLGPVDGDFGALPIGDIQPIDTLASFGKTVLTACGVDAATINQQIISGTVIQDAIAS